MGQEIFISYARTDGQWVTHLRAALAEMGIPVWIDREIEGGARWGEAIRSGLADCRVVLAALSPRITGTSFVIEEIAAAEKLRKPILPVLVEPCSLPAPLEHLNRLQFTDMSADFRAGLEKLAHTLQGHGIHRGAPLPVPPAAPSEPAPCALAEVIQGHWLANLRFASGPLQLTVSLAGNGEFVGSIAKPAVAAFPGLPFAASLPELYPYRGFWAIAGRELLLNGNWTQVLNGSSQAWAFTNFFSRITRQELSGFTVPERLACFWRRAG